jgi:hypothetical protein
MLKDVKAPSFASKIRQQAFEGAFFGTALIAMAGWVYLITVVLLKFVLWCLG